MESSLLSDFKKLVSTVDKSSGTEGKDSHRNEWNDIDANVDRLRRQESFHFELEKNLIDERSTRSDTYGSDNFLVFEFLTIPDSND